MSGTYYSLTGLLTLKPDAGGTGTDIVYKSGGASPFQQWGSPLSNFFITASGPVDGSDWAISNSNDGGQPVWIDTETPASTYALGQSEPYTIVLTTQDWIGSEQPLVTVTTTNLVDPFGTGSLAIGNLAGSEFVSNNGATGTMDLIYWQASTTPGDYAVEFQPITTTYVSAPSTGPSTVLTGSPTQLVAAVSQPLTWDTTDNYTSNSAATQEVLAYATYATATTENMYLVGFSTAGVATTSPTFAGTIADGTTYSVSYSSGTFYYSHYTSTGASGAGMYSRNFRSDHGRIGQLERLSSPSRAHERFRRGGSRYSMGPISGLSKGSKTLSMSSRTFSATARRPRSRLSTSAAQPPMTMQSRASPIRTTAQTDYTVLAYTDDNQVHLELLNNYGDQIGSDFVVPGITSFDRLHSIYGSNNSDYRVELDYTVADPSGGTEIKGLIYDTLPTGDYVTLSGGGEYIGTPFDDTFIDAAGTYTINGGGGQDNFQINQDSDGVVLAFGAQHKLVVSTSDGISALIGFTNINLNDNSITESTSTGGYTQLNVQHGSTFGGTFATFAPGDALVSTTWPMRQAITRCSPATARGAARSRSTIQAGLRLRRSMSKKTISPRNSRSAREPGALWSWAFRSRPASCGAMRPLEASRSGARMARGDLPTRHWRPSTPAGRWSGRATSTGPVKAASCGATGPLEASSFGTRTARGASPMRA